MNIAYKDVVGEEHPTIYEGQKHFVIGNPFVLNNGSLSYCAKTNPILSCIIIKTYNVPVRNKNGEYPPPKLLKTEALNRDDYIICGHTVSLLNHTLKSNLTVNQTITFVYA